MLRYYGMLDQDAMLYLIGIAKKKYIEGSIIDPHQNRLPRSFDVFVIQLR